MQDIQAAQKLLDAISDRFSSDAHEFTRVVAEACLVNGLDSCSRGFQLVPVSCCTIGAVVKQKCPDLPGKLIANLQQQKCQRYFMLIPGPPGTQPAVLLVLTAVLSKPYSKAVGKIMNKMYSSSEHPSSGKQRFPGSDSASEGSQDSNAADMLDLLQVHHLSMLCISVFCNLSNHAAYLYEPCPCHHELESSVIINIIISSVFCNLLHHAGHPSCSWSTVCMASAQTSSMACLRIPALVRTSVDSSCTIGIFPSRIDDKIVPMSALLGLDRPVSIALASHSRLLAQYGT